MPRFEYVVKDKAGQDKTGFEEAVDLNALIATLRSKGFIIVKIQEAKGKAAGVSAGKKAKKQRGKGGKVNLEDLVIFSRQMATLVGAGIPLIQSLDILANQMERIKFRVILREMHMHVQGGKSFSDAMDKHRDTFSALFVNMIRAGETSGSLEEILDRVATYLEKSNTLQKKVKAAMMYPMGVTIMAFLVTFGMMAFVIPKFASIFKDLNAPLPAPTKMLINASEIIQHRWYLVIGGIFLLIMGFKQFLKTPQGRLAWDSFQLRMPVFGPLLMKVAVSKFSRTFSTLVRSGVPILGALDIVARTSGNMKLEKIILSIIDYVKKGETISTPLAKTDIFPQMVVRMIAIGEETGELEEMLTKIADFYDAEVDAAVEGLTSLLEPLIIAFLGVVIGGIVIAMFLPILTLSQHI